MEALTLFALNALVRESLNDRFSDEYWIQAELSDVRSNATGHCYLEFVQKEPRTNVLLAKARGTIWASTYNLLKPYFEKETGQLFTSGIKVQVQVRVTFHELYGYGLTVVDIDPSYTVGDMVRRRREILLQLEEEGVLTLNKELPFPALPQRVAVISSETAAGYGDFSHQLEQNGGRFTFHVELFPALMQGRQVEESVLSALDAINQRVEEFDVVVIIRGGGATSDLTDFDTYLLAAACAQFPLPILVGIGHERDETVLDSVAHTRVKTPTAAAEFLLSCMEQSADVLYTLRERMQTVVRHRLQEEHRRLYALTQHLPLALSRRFHQARFRLSELERDIHQTAHRLVIRHRHRLALYSQQIADASPEKILRRGYSITLKDGKAVRSVSELQEGDVLLTLLADGGLDSVVKQVKN